MTAPQYRSGQLCPTGRYKGSTNTMSTTKIHRLTEGQYSVIAAVLKCGYLEDATGYNNKSTQSCVSRGLLNIVGGREGLLAGDHKNNQRMRFLAEVTTTGRDAYDKARSEDAPMALECGAVRRKHLAEIALTAKVEADPRVVAAVEVFRVARRADQEARNIVYQTNTAATSQWNFKGRTVEAVKCFNQHREAIAVLTDTRLAVGVAVRRAGGAK